MKGSGNSTYYVLSDQKETLHTSTLSEGLTPYVSPLYKGLDAIPKGFPSLPDDLKDDIAHLGKRCSKDEIKNIIKRLCVLGPLQPSQLGKILDRDAQYLRINFLSRMIKTGELVYRYPDERAHPQQAYKTPNEGGE